MRTPTKKDVDEAKAILDEALENPIGERLHDLLEEIDPAAYRSAEIIIKEFVVNPTVAVTPAGKKTVHVFTKLSDTGAVCPVPEDIDNLSPQFRWDMVCRIWNHLRKHATP